MIAVYDTNVLISGIFWRGVPRQLIHLARAGQVRVVTCQALVAELGSVLTRPDKSFRLSSTEATRVVNDVLTYSRMVMPTREIGICRDNKDNLVLACAAAGRADYIVTGDPDLLTLKNFEEISILNPRDFLSTMQTH
jgi:putative PIN family toxin of toxin-antitoxin system